MGTYFASRLLSAAIVVVGWAYVWRTMTRLLVVVAVRVVLALFALHGIVRVDRHIILPVFLQTNGWRVLLLTGHDDLRVDYTHGALLLVLDH
jgi:hypothetical protein